MRSGFFNYFGSFGSAWSPRDFFTPGRLGVWLQSVSAYEVRQNAAGTIPVTAPGDPIGRAIDKSGLSNDAQQSVSGSRPVYPAFVADGIDDFMWVVNNQAGGHDFTNFDQSISGIARLTPENVEANDAAAVWPSGATIWCLRDLLGTSTYHLTLEFGFKLGKLGVAVKTSEGSTNGSRISADTTFVNGVEKTVGFTISTNTVTIYIDGVIAHSENFNSSGIGVRAVGNATASLSFLSRTTNSGTATSRYKGSVKSSLLIDASLTAADHLAMHNYFTETL